MAGQDRQTSASRWLWRLPGHASAWWAAALTTLSLVLAWAFVTHAIPWPVLDTWVAPATLAVVVDTAAAVALVAIAALAVAVPMAVFVTLMSLVVLWPQ